MKKRYPKLIELLENLKFETDFDFDSQMIKLEHEILTKQTSNSFTIVLNIKRPRHTFLIQDSFNLTELNRNIEIQYCRKSQSILPMFPKPIPDVLERRFTIDKNQEEQDLFKEIMKKISELFAEYNYRDRAYYSASKDYYEDYDEDDEDNSEVKDSDDIDIDDVDLEDLF